MTKSSDPALGYDEIPWIFSQKDPFLETSIPNRYVWYIFQMKVNWTKSGALSFRINTNFLENFVITNFDAETVNNPAKKNTREKKS